MKNIALKSIGLWLSILAVVAPRKAGRLGLKFFGSPMRAEVNRKHLKFLENAKGPLISFEGFNAQTYRWGSGPVKILFLHGWQSHTYRWKKYIESFDQSKFTMYAMDGLGHGLSGGSFFAIPNYGNLIQKFIKEFGSMDAFVAHSMGCFASLYAFKHNRTSVPKSVVFLAPPGEAHEFFDLFRTTLGLTQHASEVILKYFEKTYAQAITDFSAPKFAEGLSVPGLLIHDENDEETAIQHSRNLQAVWKSSKLIVTHGYGHNLRSEEVVDLVHTFVMDTTVGVKAN